MNRAPTSPIVAVRPAASGCLAFALCAFLGASPLRAVGPVVEYTGSPSVTMLGWAVAGVGPWLVASDPVEEKVVVFDAATGRRWVEIESPDAQEYRMFGWSVATLNTRRPRVIVGAPANQDGGVVYGFNLETGGRVLTIENPDPRLLAGFGTSVAEVWPGNILVSAPGSGAAYIFDGTTGRLLSTLRRPKHRDGLRFGAAVAGYDTAIIGAPGSGVDDGAGAVFIFDVSTGELLWTIENPVPLRDISFGTAVASLAGDILVGAPWADAGAPFAGAAYLFSGTTGRLLQAFTSPHPGEGDQFGHAVAGSGLDRVLVGAGPDQGAGLAARGGAAYLFDADSGDHLSTFMLPASEDPAYLGQAVVAGESGLFVGAPGANALEEDFNSGAVYLFPLAGVPEMSVGGKSATIVNGDTTPTVDGLTDFGAVNIIGGTVTQTFYIRNLGDTVLHLTGRPRVLISGAAAADFAVTLDPPASIAARGVATFKVRFDPSRRGSRIAILGLASDDASENPYAFNITGMGQ